MLYPNLRMRTYILPQAYQKLLEALPPSKLKLTKVDDELFEDFKATFPELATPEALAKLDEGEMKSAAGKEKWRNFIMKVCCPPLPLYRAV